MPSSSSGKFPSRNCRQPRCCCTQPTQRTRTCSRRRSASRMDRRFRRGFRSDTCRRRAVFDRRRSFDARYKPRSPRMIDRGNRSVPHRRGRRSRPRILRSCRRTRHSRRQSSSNRPNASRHPSSSNRPNVSRRPSSSNRPNAPHRPLKRRHRRSAYPPWMPHYRLFPRSRRCRSRCWFPSCCTRTTAKRRQIGEPAS